MSEQNGRESFQLVSSYQPEAIAKLVVGVRRGDKEQTLLGVTGSGKTFTMANVIAQVNRPTLVLAHNKTLAAQLCSEFRDFFSSQRRRVFCVLLYFGAVDKVRVHLFRAEKRQ